MSRRLVGFISAVAVTLAMPGCERSAAPVRVDERSYFSRLIGHNGGKIPFPMDQLLRTLYAKASPDGSQQIQLVLVPKGRSLHRDLADFKDPRIIAAVGEQFPIFIGYAPRKEQLEVMSFNPSKAQYDFQVVTDYKPGGRPKVGAADRQLCVQCHQHGGPIFPRSPWREMRERKPGTEEAFFRKHGHTSEISSHDKDENLLGREIVSARGGERYYHGIDLAEYSSEKGFFQGHFTRGPASSYAFYLRLKNWSLQMHRAAREACGEDLECRFLLLKSALLFPSMQSMLLAKGAQEVLPLVAAYSKNLEDALKSRWPSDGFSYPSPVLPDRRVLGQPDGSSIGYVIRPRVGGEDVTYLEMLGDYIPSEFYYLAQHHLFDMKNIPLSAFHEQAVSDPKILDPKTPRPMVNAISVEKLGEFLLTNGREGLNFSDQDENLLRTLDFDQLKKAIESDVRLKSLVRQWPPDTNRAMASVLSALKRDKEAQAYLVVAEHPDQTAPAPPISVTPVDFRASKNPFVRYCASCHISESGSEDLPLEYPERLAKNPAVCSVLKKKEMPPPEQKGWQPNDYERAEMIRLLNCPTSAR